MIKDSYLKYSLGFFILILVLRIIYVFGESYINHYIINLATIASFDINIDEINNIKFLSKLLTSSVFFILSLYVIIPLVDVVGEYKWQSIQVRYIQVIAIGLLLSIGVFFSLEKVINVYVESQKKDYYKAYSINLLRYGMVSDSLTFKKFINKDSVKEYSIEDKVLLLNLYLLNMSDDITQIEHKLKKSKSNIIKQLFNDQGVKNFPKIQSKVNQLATELAKGWQEYQKGLIKANQEYNKRTTYKAILKEYNKIKRTIDKKLYKKYLVYKAKRDSFIKQVSAKTTPSQIDEYYDKLYKYFKYRNHRRYGDRAKREYKETMYEKFGHYINPNRWCGVKYCPNTQAIKNVIWSEATKKWNKQSSGISAYNNTFAKFKKDKTVLQRTKAQVNAKFVNEFGPNKLTYDTFTLNNFARVYSQKVAQVITGKVYDKLKEKMDIKIDPAKLTWSKFVKNDFVRNKLKKEKLSDKTIEGILNLIVRRDLQHFEKFYKKEFYRVANQEIDKIAYLLKNKSDNLPKNIKQIGKSSYYLVYILPKLLIITMVVSLISLLSIIFMIITLIVHKITSKNESISYNKLQKYHLYTNIFWWVIVIGFFSYVTLVPNKSFLEANRYIKENYTKSEYKIYINLLSWISYLETKSYLIVNKITFKNDTTYNKLKTSKQIKVVVSACNIRNKNNKIVGLAKQNTILQYYTKDNKRYKIDTNKFIASSCVKEID